MKNKTIVMASALLIGGLLTLNNTVFADVTDTNTSANLNQKYTQTREKVSGKLGSFAHRGSKGLFNYGRFGQDWSTQLKELVTAGTITQNTSNKIQVYIEEQQTAAKAEKEKLQGMTAEERKAYFEDNKANMTKKQNLLSTLVEKGVLTQTEADAIKAVQEAKQAEQRAAQQAKQQEQLNTNLNQLVENKTITQDQATKVIEFVEKSQAARASEMAKLKEMTKEERAAYLKSNSPSKSNILTQLVTDKVLTQEQADAVQKAIHQKGLLKGSKRNIQIETKSTDAPSL
ncbi:MAG TPA: hypothetical protein VEF53_05630 [Patescibacteria group bacterium]|nr:hypothetical protein [Patescibacteria group bacterium]